MAETQSEQHRDPRARDLAVVELELDQYGAPVPLEPAGWYVCFVPGFQKQWWHRYANKKHKHIFAMRPAGPGEWTLFEPWWHRLLTATITSEQARKFLLWGARGDVLHVREAIPGRGSQVRGWMSCATLTSYLLGRKYWVWTPHGLYKLLLREPGVCRVDISRLVRLKAAELATASAVIMACDECKPGAPKRRPGAPKPFCMNCGRGPRSLRARSARTGHASAGRKREGRLGIVQRPGAPVTIEGRPRSRSGASCAGC